MEEDIYRVDPGFLAPLLGVCEETAIWHSAELKDILRHQLHSPLFLCVTPVARTRDTQESAAMGEMESFGDLFAHPCPPLALLVIVKEFAKSSDNRCNNALPPEIATLLYYGVVLIAILRHRARITALTNEELRNGVEWALQQPWLEEIMRGLFEDAKAFLDATVAGPMEMYG